MKELKKLITKNLKQFPKFEYYFVLIKKIEANVIINPDIAIESTKALIEGICKTILREVDAAFVLKEVEGMDFHPLVKKTLSHLAKYDNGLEENFINRACSLIHYLGEIRNKRGDISHGKIAPKEECSTPVFSKFVVEMTDALMHYVLVHFFEIDFSYKEPIRYEINIEFNERLDTQYELPYPLLYSKALFEQDNVAYIDQLESFNIVEQE